MQSELSKLSKNTTKSRNTPVQIKNIYRPAPQLFIADCLSSHNHNTNRQRNPMHVDYHQCHSHAWTYHIAEEIRMTMLHAEYIGMLSELII